MRDAKSQNAPPCDRLFRGEQCGAPSVGRVRSARGQEFNVCIVHKGLWESNQRGQATHRGRLAR